MVLRDPNDPLNQSRGIMGPLQNTNVQNNRGRLRQRFDLIRKLGQGTYGKVQLGIDKETGQEVAIKTIKKSKIETEADLIRIRREIQIMSSVRHPNIIHIYEVFENREKMVLVMEYAAGGELYDYLNERKVLQEDEARRIFRQIASAVYYCHKHKICHRDLKLENILLDERSNAKIADFGLSNVFDDLNFNLLKTFCGSPLYASPEIVRGTPYCGPEVDCWSLGVLLYTLVYGAMPFDGSNFKRLVKQISQGDYYEPKKPAEASRLIKCMLTVDPATRASIKDVCAHPWINKGFDKQCLATAEELANQTPVRLDVLLSVAPQHSINHSQVVIPTPGAEGPSDEIPSTSNALSKNLSSKAQQEPEAPPKPTAAVAPFEKPARSSIKPQPVPGPSSSAAVPKPTSKSKQPTVKKKSKSSPLLDLIAVVEEADKERLEDIMDIEPGGDDEDAGDTLSEISEIQTIAEEAKQVQPEPVLLKSATPGPPEPKKPKETTEAQPVPQPEPAAKTVEVSAEPKKKVLKPKVKEEPATPVKDSAEPQPTVKPKLVKPVQPQKQEEPQPLPLPTEDDVLKKVEVPNKVVKPKEEPDKPKEEEIKTAATTAPTSAAKAPVIVKKKLVKKKTVDKEAEVKPEGPNKPPSGSGTTSANGSSSSVASSGSRTGIKDSKASRLRNRSDSNSSVDASPTRIERRNSKVISQKTAELIQNLETKTSTPNDAGKPKKLVFPSLKVSDAKRAFEKPPKPATASGTSPPKPSEEPAKAPPRAKKLIPQKSTEEPKPGVANKDEKLAAPKLKKPKSKSPSPAPPSDVETPKPIETSEEPASAATLEPEPTKAKKQKSPSPKPKPVPSPEPPSEPTTTEASTVVVAKPKPVLSKLKMQSSADQPKPVVVDNVKGPSKSEPEPQQDQKKEAVKKISSVISRIASSESAERIMREGQEKKPKTVKSQIETFVPEQAQPVKMQRTEVSFPVAAAPVVTPCTPATPGVERIIPIKFDTGMNPSTPPTPSSAAQQNHAHPLDTSSSKTQSAPNIMSRTAAMPKRMESTSTIYSRQNSSDTESSASGMPPQRLEHIKKSPREFIIPIKLEGSGQTLTPKESDPAESSLAEDPFRMDSRLRSGRFGRHKRYSSLLSDSSLDEEPSVSMSASACSTRRGSSVAPTTPSHARSHSQGDEPVNPTAPLTVKHRRSRRSTATTLDRSDSFSSAEEDDEDAFEVLTAESLFSSLLDRVRNLTKRINREDGTPWPMAESPGLGLWNAHPMTNFMPSSSRAPSESRSSFVSSVPASSGSYTMTRSYSREPSVSVTITSGPGWRRSLSRDMSGDSDSASAISETHSSSHNMPPSAGISTSTTRTPYSMSREDTTDSVLSRIQQRRFTPQRSEHLTSSPMTTSTYGSITSPSRTYGRTLSNNEYATSVTLPFRRSLTRSYDRPASYDYNAPPAATSASGSYEPSTTSHYTSSSIPHRSSSVLNTRYSPATSTTTATSLDPLSASGLSGSSRYARSLSRPRTTSSETESHRLHRDFSIPRYVSGSSSGSTDINARHSGESNGWVGGSSSSSMATSTAMELKAKQQVKESSSTAAEQTNGHAHDQKKSLREPTREQRAPSLSRSMFGFVPSQPSKDDPSPPKPKTTSRSSDLSTSARARSEAPTLLPVSLGSIPPPTVGTVITIPASSSRTEIHKTNRTSRATSVEKITRLLERKSVPRDRSVVSPPPSSTGRQQLASPPPLPPSDGGTDSPPISNGLNGDSSQHQMNGDVTKSGTEPKSSKLSKPKFIQSLEKKWERLKSPAPSPVPTEEARSNLADQTGGSDDSCSIDGPKPDSESVFLQRAVSPEKKPKSKFGSSTVNFMLGKFRKFEETSVPPTTSTVPTATSTKPPTSTTSRIGRRVQSAYAGAVSDSVLALPHSSDFYSQTSERAKSPLKSFLKNRQGPSDLQDSSRPLSLGSCRNSLPPEDSPGAPSTSSSGIPRSTSSSDHTSASSRRTVVAPPSINISAAQSYGRDHYDNDDSIMTPSSMTDSLDSASICSEKTELTRSILDDEESVSDRILRKSFYTRFNSLDRKQRSSSVHSAMPRKSSISTSASATTTTKARSSLSPASTPRMYHHSNSVDGDFANGGASSTSFARDSSPLLTKANLESLDEEYYFDPTGINKYNPNPLFKELITDEFKSDVGKKTEYSRRVTNKLSKLLREIESDIGATANNGNHSSNHNANRRSSATATMKAASYLPKPVKNTNNKSPPIAHQSGQNGNF